MKMRLIPRVIMLSIAMTLVSAGLMGCSPISGGAGNAGSATTITFWIRNSDASFVNPVVQAYNASHKTQVKLTTITDTQFVNKFGVAIAGGASPDVVAIDLIYLPAFIAANEMTDITDYSGPVCQVQKSAFGKIQFSPFK